MSAFSVSSAAAARGSLQIGRPDSVNGGVLYTSNRPV